MRKWLSRIFEWLRNFEWISSLLDLGRERGIVMLGELSALVSWLWGSPVVPALCVLAFAATVGQWYWVRKRRRGQEKQPSDLIPVKRAAEHVVRTALDPGEDIPKDALAQAFLAICKQAENGSLPISGRMLNRYAPIHDIEPSFVKICVPDEGNFTLNVRGLDGEKFRLMDDGTPAGFSRLYVSRARVSELWPSHSCGES